MKRLKFILPIILCLIVLASTVSYAAPYRTYIYDTTGKARYSPDAYVPELYVDSEYMGLEVDFDGARDMLVGPDNKVYIADTSNNRILVLDEYFKYDFSIESFINNWGVKDSFSAPAGVFVSDTTIYVCDTDNNRIVMFDTEGNFLKIVNEPSSGLFEEGSIYKPIACAVDQFGRIFVISSTTYQGVIVMDDNSEFFGFIGSQTQSTDPLKLFWRRFYSSIFT